MNPPEWRRAKQLHGRELSVLNWLPDASSEPVRLYCSAWRHGGIDDREARAEHANWAQSGIGYAQGSRAIARGAWGDGDGQTVKAAK